MRVGKKTVAALAVVAVALLLYGFGVRSVYDGYFRLTVHLRPANPDQISRVWAGAVYRRDLVEESRDPQAWADDRLKEVAKFREPFAIDVTCSWATSGFGREAWYSQYRTLVVRVEYTDGRREFVFVDIPDGRQTREVEVALP